MNTPIRRPPHELYVVDEQRYIVDATIRTDMTELAYKAEVETAREHRLEQIGVTRARYQYPALFGAVAVALVLIAQIAALTWIVPVLAQVIADPAWRATAIVAVAAGIFGAPVTMKSTIKTLLDRAQQ